MWTRSFWEGVGDGDMEKSRSGGDGAALIVYSSSVGMAGISRDCSVLGWAENHSSVAQEPLLYCEVALNDGGFH